MPLCRLAFDGKAGEEGGEWGREVGGVCVWGGGVCVWVCVWGGSSASIWVAQQDKPCYVMEVAEVRDSAVVVVGQIDAAGLFRYTECSCFPLNVDVTPVFP